MYKRQEVERARVSGGRRVATRVIGTLTGYWLWNATAWAYAYRVLGAEAERLLAERDHQGGPRPNPDPDPSPGPGPGPDLNPTFPGSVEVELHMKSFSPRCEIRAPDERSPLPPAEPPMFLSSTGPMGPPDFAATPPPAPAESPWRPPVDPPRRVLVLPLVHVSALWSGRGEYTVWCRKSKQMSEFRRPAPKPVEGGSGWRPF